MASFEFFIASNYVKHAVLQASTPNVIENSHNRDEPCQ